MPKIVADHDVEGHLQILLQVWFSPGWVDIWAETSCEIESFEHLGIDDNAPDSDVWKICQEQGVVLITGNRNAEGDDSLETTIRQFGTATSLPVLTIGNPNRLTRDRRYAEDVAAQLLDYLKDVDKMRGTGRLYLP
jgi:hypothetical protein